MDFFKLGACVALDRLGFKAAADILDVPSLKTTPDKMMNKWRDKALNKKPGDEEVFKGLKQKTLGPPPFEMPKLGGVPIEPDRGENNQTFQLRPEVESPHTNAPMTPGAENSRTMKPSDTDTFLNTIWADHDARVQLRPDPSTWR